MKFFRSFSLISLFLTVLFAKSIAQALTPEEHETIIAELRVSVKVHLANGRTILGHSIEVFEGQVQIASAKGAGEVIYTFDADEIDRFTIPGESYKTLAVEWLETGEAESAFELMHLLYLQRVKILPLLPPSESHFFIYYVELILQFKGPASAIAVAEILKPQISNEQALNKLDDTILKSYNTLKLYDEARPLAEAWLTKRSPYGGSALGYYVYGADLLRNECYEAALESALQPIVFSTPTPQENLEDCYAVAISAAIELRDKAYAVILHAEMQDRCLQWPTSDPTLKPYFKKLNSYLEEPQDDGQNIQSPHSRSETKLVPALTK